MKPKTLSELNERLVKEFMDVLVLSLLNNGHPIGGYDVIKFIYKKFHILMSSGTVYSALYSLERSELIKGNWTQKKRVYMLTERGKETLEELLNEKESVQALITNFIRNI